MFFILLLVAAVTWCLKVISLYQWVSLISVITGFYIYNFYANHFWKLSGVSYLTPLPLFGNDFKLALGLETVQGLQVKKYNSFGDVKFGGLYAMNSPVLFIKDTNLIETILVKDFSHFTDRGIPFDEKRDPLSAHLFNLTGKRWKILRSKLSPVFTSGKLKTMHQQLIDCSDILLQVLETNAKTQEAVDFKETMAKFTTDVIGSCAYGLNMNSLKDPDNEFRTMGRFIFKTSSWRKFRSVCRIILRSIHPQLNFILGVFKMPQEITDFFMNLVHTTVKARENNPQYQRNDFIQLIMNLRQQDTTDDIKTHNGKQITETTDELKVYLDDNMMAANSFLFFVAGFETTASTLTYCLFELSLHPDVQEKLYKEVIEVLGKHEGQPSYEAIKNLHYMDMVISETLRKYPPVPLLNRICTEKYTIPGTDIVLPKGCKTEIPVYSLHHDPNIYSDPENFIPERFSPENKDSIPKGAYLPFGDGPRICIGARFAQMEIKVCLSKVLSNYKIVKTPGMKDVIEFDPKSPFIMIPKDEIKMIIKPR